MPAAGAFTHAIVYVPGSHPLWIDPTAEFTPARRLQKFDQGRLALIISPETNSLTRTPQSPSREDGTTQTITIRLTEDGKNTWTLVSQNRGLFEDAARAVGSELLSVSEDKRARVMRQFENVIDAGKVSGMDFGQPKDLTKPYQLTVKGEDYHNAGAYEQMLYVYVPRIMRLPDQVQRMISQVAEEKVIAKRRTTILNCSPVPLSKNAGE